MKYLFLLCLAVSIVSCAKKEEKYTPPLACPLRAEMERLIVNFEFTGALPVAAQLYLNSEEIISCRDSVSESFCIADTETIGNKLSYYMYTKIKVEENLTIELFDNSILRLARTDESLPRLSNRPNDPCGSGYTTNITISEN